MSTEENKAVLRRLFDEFYNMGNMAVADEIMASSIVIHDASAPELRGDPALAKQRHQAQLTATPDFHITLEDTVAEGDKIAYRWTMRGTQTGPMRGIPPTGRSFAMTGMSVVRFVDGKMAEVWHNYDALGMLQQLGLIPPAGQGKS